MKPETKITVFTPVAACGVREKKRTTKSYPLRILCNNVVDYFPGAGNELGMIVVIIVYPDCPTLYSSYSPRCRLDIGCTLRIVYVS